MSLSKTLLVLALSFGLSAQAASNKEIINNISHNVILATYNDLAATSAALKVAVEKLNANPTKETLEAAQKAWQETRVPWESSEAFLFGPVDALGIDPMLDTWPLNILDLDNVLRSSRPITVDFIRALGTNLQGFHTIEYLLFGDGVRQNTKPVASLTAKQKEYLLSTSAVLAVHAAELAYAWSHNYDPENPKAPGYVQIISNPSFNNPFYSSERAVMEEFVQGMMGILDEVANGKMADPLGADLRSADVTLVESPFSWNSLSDFQNNIRSVQSIYTGKYKNHVGPGVKDLVVRVNPSLAGRVESEIAKCIQLIGDIRPVTGDFGAAIKDPAGRAKTQRAIDALNALHALMENEVLPTLDM